MDDFITARKKDNAVVSVCQDNKKKKQVYPNTQMGFNVKAGVSGIANLKALDIEKLDMEEWYFIIKNQVLGSIEYGKRSLVSQGMLINTSKNYTAAGGVNGHWTNYANLRGNENGDNGPGYDKDKLIHDNELQKWRGTYLHCEYVQSLPVQWIIHHTLLCLYQFSSITKERSVA
ncbi:unnamed protein product [Parnassius apollo]|uniref:(apollo) hypothetical protein n=1 Tax=Parnassius apollo TaxID=110799 RepID=A0A8S3Y943_PARAO|nr:unnamed protein product [Parnassius apollo]